jgi:hypothetical protein
MSVVVFHVKFYAHATYMSLFDNFFLFMLTVFGRTFSNSWLVTSTFPFACGW